MERTRRVQSSVESCDVGAGKRATDRQAVRKNKTARVDRVLRIRVLVDPENVVKRVD